MPTADAIRKVLIRTPDDALLLFALGKKLIETQSPADLSEAITLLRRAHQLDPTHLATYQILAAALIDAGLPDEARPILMAGIERVADVGEGMGRDLGPAMQAMLNSVNRTRDVRDS